MRGERLCDLAMPRMLLTPPSARRSNSPVAIATGARSAIPDRPRERRPPDDTAPCPLGAASAAVDQADHDPHREPLRRVGDALQHREPPADVEHHVVVEHEGAELE